MPEVDALIQGYLEGTLSESEAEALHALMLSNPELGERLIRQFEMDAMLRASKDFSQGAWRASSLLPKRRFTLTTVAGVAALAACITLAVTWIGTLGVGGNDKEQEETTASVAVLTRAVNVEWESLELPPGSPLSPGLLKLKSGMAQIEFYQGARVLLEGPVEFELISSGEATCMKGKLSAQVPPQAKGFRINTPKGTIVDLGTEFGLDVGVGAAEVHVFKGEVELHTAAEKMRSLKEGQAVSFDGPTRELPANSAGFASLGDIDARTENSQRSEFERWQLRSAMWNKDNGLKLRFDFQNGSGSRSLVNRAEVEGRLDDGSIVGAGWTLGRWPGKGALEFRNVSDRVRLSVPGETAVLTMAAWVRVNGLDRTYNSLFMSESWGERRVHWQIMRDGAVRLGIAGEENSRHFDYDSPVFFTPECFGRWIHLAVVFDPGTQTVSHYAEGRMIARIPARDSKTLRIGIAELGNWNDPRPKGGVAIRHLSGAMDEFALWHRALSSDEIAALAE
jgi:Concanavalin A-like lectin/glucanases superfamily/FecR protein